MVAVDIGEQLKILIQVQAVDKQLYDLKRLRGEKPTQIQQIKTAYEAETQSVKTAEEQFKALQVKRGSLEGDLASKEANVKKLQGQLYQVKTNKEYTALQHEIEGVKADNSVLEEEILKMMDQVDQQKKVIAAAQAALKEKENEMKQKVAAVEREIAELDAQIAKLQSQRQEIAPKVDPKVLQRYERIVQKKEGLGLVPIMVEREACSGCNMNVPPQEINEIRMREKWMACESCARLLYYPENETAA